MSFLSFLLSLIGLGADAPATGGASALAAAVDYDRLAGAGLDETWPEDFRMTPAHLTVIRAMKLDLATYEAGAPQVSLSDPYTVPQDELFAQVLGPRATAGDVEDFLLTLPAAMRTFFAEAEIAPGTYETRNVPLAVLFERAGIDGAAPVRLDLTPELIALARALTWEWPHEDEIYVAQSNGALSGPSVDAKRPYGDMTYYALDVHRVLGWPVEIRDESGWIRTTPKQDATAAALHALMLPVAQVLVEHATMPSVAETAQ